MAHNFRTRRAPGEIRDAIIQVLAKTKAPMTVENIQAEVEDTLGGPVAASSVRSYLQLGTKNPPAHFARVSRGLYMLRKHQ